MHLELCTLQEALLPAFLQLYQYYLYDSSLEQQRDVGADGRFTVDEAFFVQTLRNGGEKYGRCYLLKAGGNLAGLVITRPGWMEETPIIEFSDVFVLPKYREHGLASFAINFLILASNHPWRVAIFRKDSAALDFWQRLFARMPFASVRELELPPSAQFHEFIVWPQDLHGCK